MGHVVRENTVDLFYCVLECRNGQYLGQLDGLADSALTASSVHSGGLDAFRSRINDTQGHGSWASAHISVGQWLQADLGDVKVMAKVATQGRHEVAQFVTSYKLQTSVGGSSFAYVLNGDGSERVFAGNTDYSSIVEHCFDETQARFARIVPQTWYGHMSMRWEVYVTTEELNGKVSQKL